MVSSEENLLKNLLKRKDLEDEQKEQISKLLSNRLLNKLSCAWIYKSDSQMLFDQPVGSQGYI